MKPLLAIALLLPIISNVEAQISVAPNTGMGDQLFTVTITGTGTEFMQGTTTCVEFTRGNTTYNLTEVEVGSETQLTGMLETPANAPAGDYDVKVYLGPGCDGTEWDCESCFTIVECDMSVAGQGTDVSCNGMNDGTATATVAGGMAPISISWSNGMTGANITNLAAGTYEFSVEDANGCQLAGSVTVTEPDVLSASISSSMMVSCYGGQDGSFDLTVSGGTGNRTFMWDSGAGNVEDPSGLGAGTYSVVVMDANGCTATAEGIISEPDSITLIVSSTDVTGEGRADGTAAVTAEGGVGGITYLWSNGSMDAAIDGLEPGTYEVTISDANGCTKMGSAIVNGFDCALMVTSVVTQITCADDTTGSIAYNLEGASDMVSWEEVNLGAFDGTLSNLGPGSYEVVIFDSSNSCSVSIFDTIFQPDTIVITIDSTSGDQGGSQGSVFATVSGGTGNLSFEWLQDGFPVGMEEDLTGVSAGKYLLKVTDENGCVALSDTVTVEATTAVLEQYFAGSVRFFPNPTRGILQLQIENSTLQIDDEITLYDLTGHRVASYTSSARVFDLASLRSGIYLAEIGINGRKYFTKLMRL